MLSTTRWYTGAVIASLAGLAACQDAAAPAATSFDSQRVSAGMSAVQAAATANSVSALQQVARLGGTASAPALVASNATARASAALVQAALDAQLFAVSVLSPAVLGQTFTYDTVAGHYVVSGRAGAPANGVRIVLYAETATHQPIVGQETGFAELTNEAPLSATTGAVRLSVVTGGVTHLSYGVSFTLPGVEPQLKIDGFVADASNRLEFTIAASPSATTPGSGIVKATLRVPSVGVEVLATIHAAPAGSGAIDLVVTSGLDRITVNVAMSGDQVDASFTVNGALLARASGAASSPVIVGATGRALSADEREALGRIVSTTSGIVQLLGDLASPAASIVQLAASIGR